MYQKQHLCRGFDSSSCLPSHKSTGKRLYLHPGNCYYSPHTITTTNFTILMSITQHNINITGKFIGHPPKFPHFVVISKLKAKTQTINIDTMFVITFFYLTCYL